MKLRFTLTRIWLLLAGILICFQSIVTYDAQHTLIQIVFTALFVNIPTLIITWVMLQTAIAYTNYHLRTQREEQEQLLPPQPEPTQAVGVQLQNELATGVDPDQEVTVADLFQVARSVRGRRPGWIRIPISEALVQVSDERVGRVINTLTLARQGEPAAQARSAEWQLPEYTVQNWTRARQRQQVADLPLSLHACDRSQFPTAMAWRQRP
jgi:hypothetical protein